MTRPRRSGFIDRGPWRDRRLGTGRRGGGLELGPARRRERGYRTEDVAVRIRLAAGGAMCRTRETPKPAPYDPRTLTIALDDMLPMERVVVPDGGNFNGYPAMFFRDPG